MHFNLKDFLFEFAIEDYRSIDLTDTVKDTQDLIAVSEEDFLSLKAAVELEEVSEIETEDFIAKNLIEKNEEKIEELVSGNKIKIVNENRKAKLMKILFENNDDDLFQNRVEKGHISQQSVAKAFTDLLNSNSQEDEKFESKPNKVGDNSTDVTIFKNKKPISTIEVKHVSNFNDSISFFDKTIYENDNGPSQGNIFLELIKKIFKENKIVLLDLNKLQSEKLKQGLQSEPLETITSVNILLKQAHIQTGTDFKTCVKFSELPEELINILKGDGLKYTLKDPDSGVEFSCSHEYFKYSTKEITKTSKGSKTIKVFFFKPDEKLQFIYLSRNSEKGIIFSRLRAKSVTLDYENKDGQIIKRQSLRTKDLETIAKIGHGKMPRGVGTSGKMHKDCFQVTLKPQSEIGLSSSQNEIREEAFKVISDHLNDDYLAIHSENEVKIIGSPKGEDKLNLTSNKLTSKNITSVELRPYGATEVGKIRVKIECNINYENFLSI